MSTRLSAAHHRNDLETLADAGLDGPYVSPYQRISKSTTGPVLLATHWLDGLSARAYQGELAANGFLESMPFNQVLNCGPTDIAANVGEEAVKIVGKRVSR
ncbi:hypothetical protein [Mesorhizobium sp. CO1-1-4]|uniref:hypothetical protein n=1 Tax=Mesorhizobium sp. CO1-1-4 TaxID=2876633 RepID=UPI001CC9CC8D|nr:hypothetical protein [Mesorhizobium sp. CO1-1-4]MBZ9738660.1 hypothetical protein [Mesorhizobium sp. CO1-1-4]